MLDSQSMHFTRCPSITRGGFKKKAVASTLLLPAVVVVSGCLGNPTMIHLRAPLQISAPVSDGRPSALPLQDVKLARIITVGPDYEVKYSADLSSLRQIPTKFSPVPDVSVSAPQLDLADALELLGVGDRSSILRRTYSHNGERGAKTTTNVNFPKTPIKVTFSDIQEMQSDLATILKMLRNHEVEPSVDILPLATGPSKAKDSGTPGNAGKQSGELGTYLFAEVQMAKTVDVLLPRDTTAQLIAELKKDPKFGSRIEIARSDAGWDLRSSLVPPRIVSVGIVPLRPHHSKEPGFGTKANKPISELDVDSTFGWFESLPYTSYSCESTPFTPPNKDTNTTPADALKYLSGALDGFSAGGFSQQQGVGVVSNGSLLKSPESDDLAEEVDSSRHPIWSFFCPGDCVDGVVRQFVLFAGVNGPQFGESSPQARSDSVLDLIKYTARKTTQKVGWPQQPAYFVLLYLYNRHKSNILDPIGTVRTTATAHVDARLAKMMPCK